MELDSIIITLFIVSLALIGMMLIVEEGGSLSLYDDGATGLSWIRDANLVRKSIAFFSFQEPTYTCHSNESIIVILTERTVDLRGHVKACRVLVLSDNSTLISLQLSQLGVLVGVDDQAIVDPIFNYDRDPRSPRVWLEEDNLSLEFIVDKPHAIKFVSDDLEALIVTSPYSFIDANGNMALDVEEERGPFIVGGCHSNTCFITDTLVLTNDYVTPDTRLFIESHLNGTITIVYDTHPTFAHALYQLVYELPGTYTALMAGVFLYLASLFLYGSVSMGAGSLTKEHLLIAIIGITISFYNYIIGQSVEAGLILAIVALTLVRAESAPGLMLIGTALTTGFVRLIYAIASLLLIIHGYRHSSMAPGSASATILRWFSVPGLPLVFHAGYYSGVALAFALFVLAFLSARIYLELAVLVYPSELRVAVGEKLSYNIRATGIRLAKYSCAGAESMGLVEASITDDCNVVVKARSIGVDRIIVETMIWDVYGLATRRVHAITNVRSVTKSWLAWKAFASSHPDLAVAIIQRAKAIARERGYAGVGGSGGRGVGRRGSMGPREGGGGGDSRDLEGPGVARDVIGDYLGARLYVPGDLLKNVHWKKTVSTGMVMVKQFATPLGGGGGGGIEYALVLIFDFYNFIEMDRVVARTLTLLSSMDTVGIGKASLTIVMPNLASVSLTGTPTELAGLVLYYSTISSVVRIWDLAADVNPPRKPTGKVPGSILLEYGRRRYRVAALRIAEELLRGGVRPGAVVAVLGGSPARPFMGELVDVLESRGFRWVILG